jgi:hypothetical protein
MRRIERFRNIRSYRRLNRGRWPASDHHNFAVTGAALAERSLAFISHGAGLLCEVI